MPRHGGSDIGASNKYAYEKDINLNVSLYEKCRYEEHGLNVLLSRSDDSNGILMGDGSWRVLARRGYALGYYGVVSKISYSNHHNSTYSSSVNGYELLVPAHFDSINTELAIVSRFNNIIPNMIPRTRVYARNYDTGGMYSALNGEQYNFKDYYCIIRMAYDLFNIKMVIYEPIYMSNLDDFTWYWINGNWKTISEIKIEEYVKSLGISYNPSTSC